MNGYDNRVHDFETTVNGQQTGADRREQAVAPDAEGPSSPGKQIREYLSFDVAYQPGETHIVHSYRYYGSVGWGPDRRGFSYILDTARGWNGPIRSFDLRITLPKNSVLLSDWDTSLAPFGAYKRLDRYVEINNMQVAKGLYVKDGGLSLSARNYVPSKNLWVEVYNYAWYLKVQSVIQDKPITFGQLLKEKISRDQLTQYTTPELRLLRNAIFASMDYQFQDPTIKSFFDKFIWYLPDESGHKALSNVQIRNVELIQAIENERR